MSVIEGLILTLADRSANNRDERRTAARGHGLDRWRDQPDRSRQGRIRRITLTMLSVVRVGHPVKYPPREV